MSKTADVVVIGAGPAGAAAARLLAAWGHHVVLIDRSANDRARMAESLPPSASNALALIGALPSIEDAKFPSWRGNTVWWADEPARTEEFPPGAAGYQIDRQRFDGLLLRLAGDSGAKIQHGRVTEVRVEETPIVSVEHQGATQTIAARMIIDASGRSGILARQGFRVQDDQQHTIAVTAIWRSPTGWQGARDDHTLIASYGDGWAWSILTDTGDRQFTVMLDPSRTDRLRSARSVDVYRAEIAKVRPFDSLLAGAELVGEPWGADATVYSAKAYAGPGFLLAGDAASTIDPLSSFGVKKALTSGWLAAVVAHTTIKNPAMADEALAFFQRHEADVVANARRQSARFAAEPAARTEHPFWTARAQSLGDSSDLGPDALALGQDPDVLAAFADLRARPSIHLIQGSDLRIEPRAAVNGREIVMEEQLQLPRWPGGVRWLRGVDLVNLTRAAPLHRDIGDLYATVTKATPGVTLPDFLGALSVLVAFGALKHP